jgi:pectate lyase
MIHGLILVALPLKNIERMILQKLKWLLINSSVIFQGLTLFSQDKPFVILQPGMEITTDIFAAPYDYDFFLTDFKPIVITGENITIDFSGATFYGSAPDKTPDLYNGTALIIRDAKNVRIQNLRIHGFKTALFIENSTDLIIKNCDFS